MPDRRKICSFFCILLLFNIIDARYWHTKRDVYSTTGDYKDELFKAMASIYKILKEHVSAQSSEFQSSTLTPSEHSLLNREKSIDILSEILEKLNDNSIASMSNVKVNPSIPKDITLKSPNSTLNDERNAKHVNHSKVRYLPEAEDMAGSKKMLASFDKSKERKHRKHKLHHTHRTMKSFHDLRPQVGSAKNKIMKLVDNPKLDIQHVIFHPRHPKKSNFKTENITSVHLASDIKKTHGKTNITLATDGRVRYEKNSYINSMPQKINDLMQNDDSRLYLEESGLKKQNKTIQDASLLRRFNLNFSDDLQLNNFVVSSKNTEKDESTSIPRLQNYPHPSKANNTGTNNWIHVINYAASTSKLNTMKPTLNVNARNLNISATDTGFSGNPINEDKPLSVSEEKFSHTSNANLVHFIEKSSQNRKERTPMDKLKFKNMSEAATPYTKVLDGLKYLYGYSTSHPAVLAISGSIALLLIITITTLVLRRVKTGECVEDAYSMLAGDDDSSLDESCCGLKRRKGKVRNNGSKSRSCRKKSKILGEYHDKEDNLFSIGSGSSSTDGKDDCGESKRRKMESNSTFLNDYENKREEYSYQCQQGVVKSKNPCQKLFKLHKRNSELRNGSESSSSAQKSFTETSVFRHDVTARKQVFSNEETETVASKSDIKFKDKAPGKRSIRDLTNNQRCDLPAVERVRSQKEYTTEADSSQEGASDEYDPNNPFVVD